MKQQMLCFLLIAVLVAAAHGHTEMMTPDDMVRSMMAQQGVSSAEQLDCSKITQPEMEALGDAVMERMAGDHELHEQMDAMMGGEGSMSLRQMHTTLGSNWLGCTGEGMMGSMGSGMMMPMMMRMMGNAYPAYYNGFDTVLVLGVIGWVLFLGTGVYFVFLRKENKRRKRR
ncbi:MAG: hypothetical protein HYY37_05260 [Candidatus Aenigmarchaeota archaeon]|nr:hypothetical protein [Candidatus Aenigmarchaeota archaeon]